MDKEYRTVIEAGKSKVSLNLAELVRYKDLFMILAWRDLKVRYAQTFLGLLWALLQPLAMLLLFILIFGRALQVETGDVPYPVFALSGMAIWTYFSFVLQQSGNSIIGAQEMVKKIYFPRLVIPLSKSITAFVEFSVTFLFLIGMMVYYKVIPGSEIFYLPLFFLIAVMISLGSGIWISALTIRYRDLQHIIPFVVQIGLYASPVAYPATMIPEKWKWLYYCNPMAGVIDGFRFSMVGQPLDWNYAGISIAIGLVLFFTSLFYFKRVERIMADLV